MKMSAFELIICVGVKESEAEESDHKKNAFLSVALQSL